MLTLLILFGIRFNFYANDQQLIYIHVENADGEAKFEIENEVKLVYNSGIKNKDILLAESIIEENRENLIEQRNYLFRRNLKK